MPSDEALLPIKVVLPSDSDVSRPEPGGGPRKQFGEVTPEIRQGLINQLDDVEQHFRRKFSRFPNTPAVARVVLKREALAKSHRPSGLLT